MKNVTPGQPLPEPEEFMTFGEAFEKIERLTRQQIPPLYDWLRNRSRSELPRVCAALTRPTHPKGPKGPRRKPEAAGAAT